MQGLAGKDANEREEEEEREGGGGGSGRKEEKAQRNQTEASAVSMAGPRWKQEAEEKGHVAAYHSPILLRTPYALSGTEIDYPTILRTPYALSGTELGYLTVLRARGGCPAMLLRASYALSGTDLGAVGTRRMELMAKKALEEAGGLTEQLAGAACCDVT
eukprot:182994-Rhodomonas_salina.2